MSKHNEMFIKQLEESKLDKKIQAQILSGIGSSSSSTTKRMISFNDDEDSSLCTIISNVANNVTASGCASKYISVDSVFDSDRPDRCITADIPDLTPTVSVRWGDSINDNLETSDDEVVCIRICNHYNNVGFKNIKLSYAFFTNDNNIDVTPNGGLCFGDLSACEDGGISCASNQLSIVTKNCTPGVRYLVLFFCYEITMGRVGLDVFPFDFIPS